jgi:hypothetical protein
MNQGQLMFAQLMQHLPLTTFRRCVSRYARRLPQMQSMMTQTCRKAASTAAS